MLCCRISPYIHLDALFLILNQLDKCTISSIYFCAGCARCAASLSPTLRKQNIGAIDRVDTDVGVLDFSAISSISDCINKGMAEGIHALDLLSFMVHKE